MTHPPSQLPQILFLQGEAASVKMVRFHLAITHFPNQEAEAVSSLPSGVDLTHREVYTGAVATHPQVLSFLCTRSDFALPKKPFMSV